MQHVLRSSTRLWTKCALAVRDTLAASVFWKLWVFNAMSCANPNRGTRTRAPTESTVYVLKAMLSSMFQDRAVEMISASLPRAALNPNRHCDTSGTSTEHSGRLGPGWWLPAVSV
eukprot:928233-Amphidinium_carterae.1